MVNWVCGLVPKTVEGVFAISYGPLTIDHRPSAMDSWLPEMETLKV